MKTSISLIDADNFTRKVLCEKRPLLLLCMPMNADYPYQLDLIKKTSAAFEGLLTCGLLEDTFLAVFNKNYNVVGTPTFLILSKGKEVNRLLGLAEEESLIAFILNSNVVQPPIVA